MKRRTSVLSTAVLLAACSSSPDGAREPTTPGAGPASEAAPDRGSPTQIQTAPVSVEAYDVVVDCQRPGVGILGKGDVHAPSPEEIEDAASGGWTTGGTGRRPSSVHRWKTPLFPP